MIQELRIGNYILDCESDPNETIYWRVEEIRRNTVGKRLGVVYRNGSVWSAEPEFIELTEEILLKCGFEKSAWDNYSTFRNLFCSDGSIVISLEHKYIEIGDLTLDIEIKYLNQLQNLYFALTGTELEINL